MAIMVVPLVIVKIKWDTRCLTKFLAYVKHLLNVVMMTMTVLKWKKGVEVEDKHDVNDVESNILDFFHMLLSKVNFTNL